RMGTRAEVRAGIVGYMVKHQGAMFVGEPGLDDTMSLIREQFFRFAQEKVTPFAHQWHLKDELIPLAVVKELGDLGVFGLTIPESHGGSGLSKLAMCVVSEELSRGYIGVGSLATRSEIAAELILNGGTKEQRDRWLADCERRETSDRSLHRTVRRLGCGRAQNTRCQGRRRLQDLRQQDLDHACGARRHDDIAGSDEP